MTKEERIKIYNEAEKEWGLVAQYDQAIEEMAELIVAINKYKRKILYKEYKGKSAIEENLIEEIADVKMCIEQLEQFVGEKNVAEIMDAKMQKLIGQIEEMKKMKKE